MKKKLPLISVFFITVIFAAACTPFLQRYVGYPPYSQQMKMQSVYYWDILAHDIASRLNNALIQRDHLDSSVVVKSYLEQTGKSLPFDKVFKELLTTQLVGLGIPTLSVPDDEALQIKYGVQVIFHQTGRQIIPRPDGITSLAETVFVAHNSSSRETKIDNVNLLDSKWEAFIISGHYEVIITTSIKDNNFYVFRDSSIYYINDIDNFLSRPKSADKHPEKPLPPAAKVDMVNFTIDEGW